MEQSREEFEAWAKERGLIIDLPGIRSVNESFLNECWAAWQASRAAVVVTLPEALIPAVHTSGEPFMRPEPFGFYLNRDDVIKAVKAQGLTVK